MDEADVGCASPWQGEIQRPRVVAQQDVEEGEPAAGLEHAEGLVGEALAVADVHDDVLRPDHIKCPGFEGEAGSIAQFEAAGGREPALFGEDAGAIDEIRREVHPGDVAAELGGEHSRCAPDTRTKVDDTFARLEGGEFRELASGDYAAGVEFVHRRECGRRDVGDACGGGSRKDCASKVRGAVVRDDALVDGIAVGHCDYPRRRGFSPVQGRVARGVRLCDKGPVQV